MDPTLTELWTPLSSSHFSLNYNNVFFYFFLPLALKSNVALEHESSHKDMRNSNIINKTDQTNVAFTLYTFRKEVCNFKNENYKM